MDKVHTGLSALSHHFATSDDAFSRAVRRAKRGVYGFSLPVLPAVARPAVWGYLAAREAWENGVRVFVAQPLLQASCKRCGPGLRTGSFVHYIQGRGDIVLGSDVWFDGKSTISFAARFDERPTLEIGDGSAIGHLTVFTIGRRVTVGKNCIISGDTLIFDSNGHPSDPIARRNQEPPPVDQVRPVTIGDDVWIGKRCIVFPGVRIGDCAIVSAGSVVRRHVPPYTVVAGNPAQIVLRLPKPEHAVEARGSEG